MTSALPPAAFKAEPEETQASGQSDVTLPTTPLSTTATALPSPAQDAAFDISVRPGGWTFAALPGQTVLQAAHQGGIELPSSCRNGTCRTCLCQIENGRVRHTVLWPGLSAEEKAEGWILPCIALPESDLVLIAPRACPKE